jgi:alkanesulfonate monooxygenase SsuD/methylene tetrahydromethanopterin reductase-like flavin-dependent oxidoreductase (luciferase family)
MVDDAGEVRRIGIAPQTLQDPTQIEIMVPFTMSAEAIEWCAREGAHPILFTPIPEYVRSALDAYHKAASEAGRDLLWGEGVGHFREIVVAESDAEAEHLSDQGLGYVWTTWHDWFGFNEALRRPGEEGAVPNTAEAVRERGYSIAGSVDTVARKLEAMLEITKTRLLVPWIFAGPAPIEGLLRSNELLIERVLPKLGIELERRAPVLRGEVAELWRHEPA